MIYISCGLNQEFIIDLLEKTTEEGVSFKYEGKTGIKLAFHVNTEDLDKACAIAKKTIKATPIGSVMYFQVTTKQKSEQHRKKVIFMTRWGLFAVTIGCIIMMYSQTYNDFSQKILYCICGVTVLCLGAFMVYKDKKNVKKK